MELTAIEINLHSTNLNMNNFICIDKFDMFDSPIVLVTFRAYSLAKV